jgi:hypothetical protein
MALDPTKHADWEIAQDAEKTNHCLPERAIYRNRKAK